MNFSTHFVGLNFQYSLLNFNFKYESVNCYYNQKKNFKSEITNAPHAIGIKQTFTKIYACMHLVAKFQHAACK